MKVQKVTRVQKERDIICKQSCFKVNVTANKKQLQFF